MVVYEHGDRDDNRIFLTFDDGPNTFWTLKILDLLDKYSIKANFFVLGQCAEIYPDILKEIYDRGHMIGNHSYSHSREIGDFQKSEDVIFKIIKVRPKFIRPPYLNVSLCGEYCAENLGEDIKIINTDVFPLDYLNKADYILDFVIKNVKNGSIILLHDGSRKQEERENRPAEMFKALPLILEKLKDKFKFARLDEANF